MDLGLDISRYLALPILVDIDREANIAAGKYLLNIAKQIS